MKTISDSVMEKIRAVTSDWACQSDYTDCMVCSIYNIALEISTRPVAPLEKKFSMSEVSKCLGYKTDEGTSWDNLDPGMKRMLRKAKSSLWTAYVKEDDRRLPIKRACELVENKMSSYPTMTLGAEYLRDMYGVILPKNPMAWMSHMVVLVYCDIDDVVIFDPYAIHIHQNPLRVITKKDLNKYWQYSNVPKGIACFKRSSGILEEFVEVEQ